MSSLPMKASVRQVAYNLLSNAIGFLEARRHDRHQVPGARPA